MSENSSRPSLGAAAGMILGLPLWVVASFVAAIFAVTQATDALIKLVGIEALGGTTIAQTVVSVVVYALTLALVIGVPWLVWRRRTTRRELGLDRGPVWSDLPWAPAAFVAYMILTNVVGALAPVLIPHFDSNQAQEVGFTGLTQQYQYVLAFFTLVVVAPLAEETLFRGYLYGKLRRIAPLWLTVLIVSVLFGAVHLQWNVGVDVFVMSVVVCLLRESTGSIWAGVGVHMLKNGLAFYLLFINPAFLHTIGG